MTDKTTEPEAPPGREASDLTRWLERYGISTAWDLLEIAESAKPPKKWDDHIWTEKEFSATNGWVVVIFYDGDELDYIDKFVTPDGKDVNFWDWPEEHEWKNTLMNWREVGDLKRLKAL